MNYANLDLFVCVCDCFPVANLKTSILYLQNATHYSTPLLNDVVANLHDRQAEACVRQ